MMKFARTLKNRIAFYYILTTAILVFVAFLAVYSIVKITVYHDLDRDIQTEVKKHLSEISVQKGIVTIEHEEEWREREHNTLDVNPVFIQFSDTLGKVFEKSPNLKKHALKIHPEQEDKTLYDCQLEGNQIRQIQVPLYEKGKKIGYLIIAMSLVDGLSVLHNLFIILVLAYPTILLILFLIARSIAGRSIRPIQNVISTARMITRENLKSRITPPVNRDEIFTLTETINALLDRIEQAVEREKQFTSDASHELRTPLAVIRGTLEVLQRKPRLVEEYNQKINHCITEVDRINSMIEQLLVLARLENQKQSLTLEPLVLNEIISSCWTHFDTKILDKQIQIKESYTDTFEVASDRYFLTIILHNLVSNALKYSPEKSTIEVAIQSKSNGTLLCLKDQGMGINPTEWETVFQPFYRSKAAQDQPEIKGHGLGLSIVSRLCELLGIQISLDSKEGGGTSIFLFFPTEI
ncbi:HAMP domain-containing sensor histidine kinase [Flavobacterium sp.]|uniref:sensor histidine kinase n=1 Tax=Flavobacterium sp. TaxID=239 RepID=UPI00333E677E